MFYRAMQNNHLPETPDQCTVNRYEPGQGIPPHIDASDGCCGPAIASLSLGDDVVMEFGAPVAEGKGRLKVPVLLPRRSLMVMTGEAR